jgi:TetR/AcrR family transcriptional regulator, transcriptional repressor for nem operon
VGRIRSFETEDILAATAQLFRRLGFAATSLKDLERETGLQAGSLYNAFGNKKAVFLCSLDAYHETVVQYRIKRYLKGDNPIAELVDLFTSTYRVEGIPNAGCLLTNTAAEIGGDDPEIQSKVEEGFSLLRDAFRRQMLKARQLGIANPAISTGAAAEFLLTAYQGLLVRVRNGAPPDILEHTVRLTVNAVSQKRINRKKAGKK